LIADRDKIEHVVEECIRRPIDAVAARTKESDFAMKSELTMEDDK